MPLIAMVTTQLDHVCKSSLLAITFLFAKLLAPTLVSHIVFQISEKSSRRVE